MIGDLEESVKTKEAEIRVNERTIAMCHEDDDNYQAEISKLNSTLAHLQAQLKRDKNSLGTFTKTQAKKLDLCHANGVRIKNGKVIQQQEEDIMALQEKAEGRAEFTRAEKKLKKQVGAAVERGEMSIEEAFGRLCLSGGDCDEEVDDDEYEDGDSGMDVAGETDEDLEMT